jgi:Peptidase family M28
LTLISTARSFRLLPLSACLLTLTFASGATAPAQENRPLDQVYAAPAKQLITAALHDGDGYTNLSYLCDHIGKRISGSEPLARAVAWSADLMRKDGLENVAVQKVMVPHWVRGQESGAILAPVAKPLHMIGLGMSVGTPAGGLDAEVVVVNNFEELTKLGRAGVASKIVVFNAPYEGYGRTVMYRVSGPSRAAALGAVAVLVRSITPLAVQLPHTGTLVYDKDAPQIPAAAISIEDALMLARLTAEGAPVRLHLDMQAHMEPDAESANVMGEIVGSEHPEEVVVLGGHIDSWDVGQGAQDDGSGIMATLEAVNVITRSGLRPKRTIRIVFWVNEENGGAGGIAYRKSLGDDVLKQVAAIEMDGGAEAPIGYGYGSVGNHRATPNGPAPEPQLTDAELHSLDLLKQIGTLLEPVGATSMRPGGGGSDIEPLMAAGVPGLGELTTAAHYFDWHHTEADTLDKVDPVEFRKNVASLAVMTYVLADMPERLAGHKGLGAEE